MDLISAGAAQTVTGSCHLLDDGHQRVLVDCGLFQGPREIDRLNLEPFPFEPGSVDALLLTHAHLDHVGRLPKLVKEGFSGPIHATRPTREIAEIILRDAARLQHEDYQRARRRARRSNGREAEVEAPLFDEADVERTLAAFAPPVAFETPLRIGEWTVSFQPAGHILGSAYLVIDTPDGRVVASGDLGNRESALQSPAAPAPDCDAVLVETTYADRTHRSREATEREFFEVIDNAITRGGNIMVPSFALERTQQVLYELFALQQTGRLPSLPIFLDSPMATKMTRLYRECANEFQPDVAGLLERGVDPFDPDQLTFTVDTEASKRINEIEGGALIIAGSGMMTGGRILHHLRHNLENPSTVLVVVGYQGRGTLGRRLIDGARRVRIHGDDIEVRATVHTIGGFSAHADRDDLTNWLSHAPSAHAVLVHGEVEVMDAFASDLGSQGRRVTLPELGQRYRL